MEEFLDILSVFALISVAILTLVLVLASLGKTLGIRKLYISLLLLIFEVNRKTVFKGDYLNKNHLLQKKVPVSRNHQTDVIIDSAMNLLLFPDSSFDDLHHVEELVVASL